MGHTGTLDPLASGLLLIATDTSTKLIRALEGCDKTYIFTVRLDGTSETLDLGSTVLSIDTSNYKHISQGTLIKKLESLTEQVPPKHSALHINGARAYELARKWKDFDIPTRKIHVKDVKILDQKEFEITIQLRISSGGYIRSLAPEIGTFFGVNGGYITQLQRTILHLPSWDLQLSESTSIENMSKKDSISYNTLFSHFEHAHISPEQKQMLLEGKDITLETEPKKQRWNILLFCDAFVSWCTFEWKHCTIKRNYV